MPCAKHTEQGTKWIAVTNDGVIVGEFYTRKEALEALGIL